MATASLGGYSFDIDPSTAKWSYELNTNKIETYGGTVVQILSRNIGDLTITGYLSSKGLTNATRYDRMKEFERQMQSIMDYHVANNESVRFYFPILGWDGKVFLKNVSNLSYNPRVSAISYQLTMFVDTGFSTIQEAATTDALNTIQDGVGWTRNIYNTPDQDNWENTLQALKQVVENSGSYDAYGVSLYDQLQAIEENEAADTTEDDGTVQVNSDGGTSSIVNAIWQQAGSVISDVANSTVNNMKRS